MEERRSASARGFEGGGEASAHLYQVGQTLEQLAQGEESVFAGVERDPVDHEVALAQRVHPEAVADVAVLLGHEQVQHLGGQRSQRLPVDQLQLTTLGAVHHLNAGRETLSVTLAATDFNVKPNSFQSWIRRKRPSIITLTTWQSLASRAGRELAS